MTGRRLALLMVAAGLVSGLRAAELTARVDRPRVTIGQSVRYTLTVEGGEAQASTPEFPEGLELMGQSSSRSISLVNGRMSQTIVTLFQLRAIKVGTWTIPPVKARTRGGGSVLSRAVRVEVTKPRPRSKSGKRPEEPLFLEVSLTPKAVYLGEPLALHSRVYMREGFRHARPPQGVEGRFDGFRVDQQTFDNSKGSWVTRPSGRYSEFDVDRKILVPLEPGEFTIIPGSAYVKIFREQAGFRGRRRGGFGFGSFFDPPATEQELAAEPQFVKVSSVPTKGRPADYDGVIGRGLKLSSSVGETRVEVGKPVTLEVLVEGRADLRGLRDLPIEFPAGVTVFETKGNRELEWRTDGAVGRAAFEIILVPNRPGKITLPAVELAWFDAEHGRFDRLRSPAIELEVTGELPQRPVATGLPAQVVRGPSVEAVAAGRTLRFLREEPGELRIRTPPLHARTEGLLWLLGLLALGGALEALARHRERFAGDAAGLRAARAHDVATRALTGLAEDDPRTFYGELGGVLREYVAARMRRETGGATADELTGLLRDRGVDEELLQQWADLLGRVEEARYSRVVGTTPARDKVLAQGWIEKVERCLR